MSCRCDVCGWMSIKSVRYRRLQSKPSISKPGRLFTELTWTPVYRFDSGTSNSTFLVFYFSLTRNIDLVPHSPHVGVYCACVNDSKNENVSQKAYSPTPRLNKGTSYILMDCATATQKTDAPQSLVANEGRTFGACQLDRLNVHGLSRDLHAAFTLPSRPESHLCCALEVTSTCRHAFVCPLRRDQLQRRETLAYVILVYVRALNGHAG